MTDFVAAVTFPDRAVTYEAYSKVADTGATGAYELVTAAVVERQADGTFTIPEGADGNSGMATLSGSLIGMLLGILGGPIGMLLGLGVGAVSGALIDADRADDGEDAVSEFARTLQPGTNALLLRTREGTTDALDRVVGDLGGMIVRRPTAQVLDALEAQEEAERKAAKAARKAMRKQEKQARKDAREAKQDELEQKHDERIQKLKDRRASAGS